jgi:hypothetical protein
MLIDFHIDTFVDADGEFTTATARQGGHAKVFCERLTNYTASFALAGTLCCFQISGSHW